jgi:hypothetical protein
MLEAVHLLLPGLLLCLVQHSGCPLTYDTRVEAVEDSYFLRAASKATGE